MKKLQRGRTLTAAMMLGWLKITTCCVMENKAVSVMEKQGRPKKITRMADLGRGPWLFLAGVSPAALTELRKRGPRVCEGDGCRASDTPRGSHGRRRLDRGKDTGKAGKEEGRPRANVQAAVGLLLFCRSTWESNRRFRVGGSPNAQNSDCVQWAGSKQLQRR